MESTALELQKTNKELQSETAVMRKRYQTVVQTVENLESKCDDYRTQVEELQIERMRLQREMANSLSLQLTCKENGSYELARGGDESDETEKDEKVLSFKKDIEILNDRIMQLKRQHSMEKRRREELELELSDLIQENQQLDKELFDFAEQARQWQESASEDSSLSALACSHSGHRRPLSESTDDESFVLLDSEIDRQVSAMSDQSEVEILNISQEVKSPLQENSTSFLSELGSQYHELVRKYDSLVERCKNEGIVREISQIPTVQRAIQTSPLDEKPTTEIGASGPLQDSASVREYKKLFAQIYSKLQTSQSGNPAEKKLME